MEEIKNDIIAKYQYYNYIIYKKEHGDFYEYYLQNEKHGVITLMFGLTKETEKDHLSILTYNIDAYIDDYEEEIED